MTAAKKLIEPLTPAGREFLVSQLWNDSPRGVPAALSADTAYRPARQISDAGLAERETDGDGSAWYYLNDKGWKARRHLQEQRAEVMGG